MKILAFLLTLVAANMSTSVQADSCLTNVERLQKVGNVITLMLSAKLGIEANFDEVVAKNSCIHLYDPAADEYRCHSVTMRNINDLSAGCSLDNFSSLGETNLVSVALTCVGKKNWPNLLFTVEGGRVTRIVHAPSPVVLSSRCPLGS